MEDQRLTDPLQVIVTFIVVQSVFELVPAFRIPKVLWLQDPHVVYDFEVLFHVEVGLVDPYLARLLP